MEAALRTAYETITGKELEKLEFEEVRGKDGIKKAAIKIGDKEIKVAVAHGLANAEKILQEIETKKADYQFVEIMACRRRLHNGRRATNNKFKKKEQYRCKKSKSKIII